MRRARPWTLGAASIGFSRGLSIIKGLICLFYSISGAGYSAFLSNDRAAWRRETTQKKLDETFQCAFYSLSPNLICLCPCVGKSDQFSSRKEDEAKVGTAVQRGVS